MVSDTESNSRLSKLTYDFGKLKSKYEAFGEVHDNIKQVLTKRAFQGEERSVSIHSSRVVGGKVQFHTHSLLGMIEISFVLNICIGLASL